MPLPSLVNCADGSRNELSVDRKFFRSLKGVLVVSTVNDLALSIELDRAIAATQGFLFYLVGDFLQRENIGIRRPIRDGEHEPLMTVDFTRPGLNQSAPAKISLSTPKDPSGKPLDDHPKLYQAIVAELNKLLLERGIPASEPLELLYNQNDAEVQKPTGFPPLKGVDNGNGKQPGAWTYSLAEYKC
jgi:hypothetical protein